MSDTKVESVHLETIPAQSKKVDETQMTTSETENPDHSYKISIRTYLVLFCMGISWGTCTLANIGPSTTYHYAVDVLGGDSIGSWIPNAALFPLIGLQPVWGSLSDRIGKKWLIVAGGFVGIAGNAVSGSAKSVEVIIAGQAITGVGSSLLLLSIPTAMEIVPAKHRSFAQGMTGLINGLLAILALLESGAFAKMSAYGWRWVFYFNAIFFGFSGFSTLIFYRPPTTKLRRENSTSAMIKSIDVLGIVLLLCAVVGIVTSLTWGGNAYPWNSSRVISFLVLGVLFLIIFGVYETFGRKDGLIDHRFLESRNFLLVLSVAFLDGMLIYGVNAFLPTEISAIFTSDPIKINVYLLPLNILLLVGIVVSSYVLGVLQQYRLLMVLSVTLLSIFCGLLALITESRLAMMLVFTGLVGFGVGVTTMLPVVILTYAVPSHLIGTALTLLASVRALGGTIGITIFASIYGNSMSADLPTSVAKAAIEAGLPTASVTDFVTAYIAGDTGVLNQVAGITPVVLSAAANAVKAVTTHAFRYVWIANAAIGVFTAFLTLFLQPVKHKMTVHVESPLEKGKLRDKAEV